MAARTSQRPASPRLEVHEHAFITSPRSKASYRFDPATRETTWQGRTDVVHSHPDGNAGHEHPDTGPSTYTIDRDEWYAATGLRGGGRKTFTARPSGEQLPFVARTAEEQTFLVVFCDEGFTDEIARSTHLTQSEWEAHRDAFKAAARGEIPDEIPGEPGNGGAAVARVALSFGMTPIYRYDGPPARPERAPASRTGRGGGRAPS